MMHIFFFQFSLGPRTRSGLRIRPSFLENTASIQNSEGIGEVAFVRFASSGPFSHSAQNSRAAGF